MLYALCSMPPMRVKGYIAALPAVLHRQRIDYSYKVYVTDSLQALGQNKYLRSRWLDSVDRKSPDDRTAEEIAQDVIDKAGLIVKGGEIYGLDDA